VDQYQTRFTARLKSSVLDVLIIIAAVVGTTFLLRKGGEAGARRATLPRLPPSKHQILQVAPVRPQAIAGRVDNFKEAIVPEPIRSWDTESRYGITLRVSPDPVLNQPSARVLLLQTTTSPVVLEVQYTVPEDLLQMLSANDTAKDRTDGVTVLVTTVGRAYNQSALLKLDPLRIPEQRKWLTYNLAVPSGTREIDFTIIGAPPHYNVFLATCVISLPQLRVAPTK
jgi:hypothetical protein